MRRDGRLLYLEKKIKMGDLFICLAVGLDCFPKEDLLAIGKLNSREI